MNIITKYKDYLKLLESKYSETFLKDNNNGLDFYLIDNDNYSYYSSNNMVHFTTEKYEIIKKRLKFDNNFLRYVESWGYGSLNHLELNLFKNRTGDAEYGEVQIMALVKDRDERINIDTDDYYFLKFNYNDSEQTYYICDGWYGIKRCIIYNILYNEQYDNQIFYDEILNLLKPNQVKELMENIDYNQIVWYNNLSYVNYGMSNNLIDINKITYLSNLWYLVEKGVISKQDFVNKHPNWFLLKDNEVYIRYTKGDLVDLSFMFSKDDGGNRNPNSRQFVENLEDNDFYRETTSFEDLYLNYLKPESIKLIEDKIQEIKSKLSIDEQEEFDEYDDWEDQIKNIDALNDLKDAIETAFQYAQEDADSDEIYKAVKTPILFLFGMEKLERDENDHYIFLLSKDFLIRFDNYFSGNYKYNLFANILNQLIIENWFEIVQEDDDSVELLEINFPYYGFNGSIDKDYLHECIEEKLSEI